MDKGIKLYHTSTQEDYDKLMKTLNRQKYLWGGGEKPLKKNKWLRYKEDTVVSAIKEYKMIRYGNHSYYEEHYPDIKIQDVRNKKK